jgi:hypothetical protein
MREQLIHGQVHVRDRGARKVLGLHISARAPNQEAVVMLKIGITKVHEPLALGGDGHQRPQVDKIVAQ